MDHSQMDHSMPGMDHGDEAMCSMNMSFTWDWTNLCIVFKWWHISSTAGLFFSLLIVAGAGVFYEWLRARVKRLENKPTSLRLEDEIENGNTNSLPKERVSRVQKAALYALLVGYSYMLMLVFMTYNGWIMLSVVAGAGIGNYLFGTEIQDSLACH